MKLRVRMLALLSVFVILFTSVCIVPIGAEPEAKAATGTDDARYTRKVVSVVFDNSGSMATPDKRNSYSLYALQILAASLDSRDTLFIVPMNRGPVDSTTGKRQGVKVDLSATDRNAEIQRIVTQEFCLSKNTTPYESIIDARDLLISEGGLPDKDNLAKQDEDTEYWLMVFTDGEFSDPDWSDTAYSYSEDFKTKYGKIDSLPENTDEQRKEKYKQMSSLMIEENIRDYPSLKTIYLGLSEDAPNLTGVALTTQYPFTPYHAKGPTELIGVMQLISNQMSGRYTLGANKLTVSGNTVTINLEEEFSFKSVSVIAQNCGAILKTAQYNGKSVDIENLVTVDPNATYKYFTSLGINAGVPKKIDDMAAGCSAVIQSPGTPDNMFFSGGTLTLTFDKPVAVENLSILAEPALEVVAYLEYKNGAEWIKADIQYINENISAGGEVRIAGYDVYRIDRKPGEAPVDIQKIFGDVTESITYAGGTDTIKIKDSITLIEGNNSINLTVSMKNDTYKLYDSFICCIEKESKFYRIEAEYGSGTLLPTGTTVTEASGYMDVYYTVYRNDKKLSKTELENGYTWTLTSTNPNNANKALTPTVQSDGRVKAQISADSGLFGAYDILFRVADKETGVPRTHTYTMDYSISNMVVECVDTPDSFWKDPDKVQAKFTVSVSGAQVSKKDLEAGYTLEAVLTHPNGTETPLTYTIENTGKITCPLNIAPGDYGNYSVRLSVDAGGAASGSATHSMAYSPQAVTVTGTPGTITRDNPKVEYTVKIDGKTLTKAEIERYNFYIVATLPGGRTVNPDYTVEENGTVKADFTSILGAFGAYTFKATIEVADKTGDCEHRIENYPPSITLNVLDGGSLDVTQHQLLTNDRAVRFELFADGVPFAFENGLTAYRVMLGNKDITQYVTANENILSYIPLAEHFGGTPPVGANTVTLSISCAAAPQLSGTETATVNITKTVYEIVSLGTGGRDIDRFRLTETDAVIYFSVLRDGICLTEEELQTALDSGELNIKDETGTFTKWFWLPVGKDVTVTTVDGTPVVAYAAVKDWIRPFDSYAAMLILNGDRPITATCHEAMLTESFTFGSSNWWSYVWRIYVIFFVIHCIFYVIGFFNGKCKSLPRGLIVTSHIGGDGAPTKLKAIKFNFSFWEKYGWHFARFVPHPFGLILWIFREDLRWKVVWYDQPPKPLKDKTTMKYNEEGVLGLEFKDKRKRLSPQTASGAEGNILQNYQSYLNSYTGAEGKIRSMPNVSGNTIRSRYKILPNDLNANTFIEAPEACYGKMDAKGQLSSIIYFINKD